jgi:hypothetical protein
MTKLEGLEIQAKDYSISQYHSFSILQCSFYMQLHAPASSLDALDHPFYLFLTVSSSFLWSEDISIHIDILRYVSSNLTLDDITMILQQD